MRQYADLGGNLPVLPDFPEPAQNPPHLLRAVRHRVQADDRVPRAEAQPLQGGGGNALRVVGGVVGLQAAGKRSRKADGGVAVGGDGDFIGCVNQVEIAHELAHRRHHFGGQPPADSADVLAGGGFVQKPLPELRHRPAPDFPVDLLVYVVLDNPGDFVLLIGHGRIFPQLPQSHGGEHHLSRHPLPGGLRRQACQFVPGFFLVCLGQNLL